MIKNYDESVEINHNSNWPHIPDHFYRILIITGSEFIYLFSISLLLTNFISTYNKTSSPQTARPVTNIRCDQAFEPESQLVVLIKVNINQNRNGKDRKMHSTDK